MACNVIDRSDFLRFISKEGSRKLDLPLIEKAFDFGQRLHCEQKRDGGDPYFVHPINVAKTMASMNFDTASICAALLHDTVEDTCLNLNLLKEEFGEEVAFLVDGLTKLQDITFRNSNEKNAENFRKLIVATAKDIRVLIIKMADRLDNMRTLDGIKDESRRQRIANETLMVYVPLAERIGMYNLKYELEDLAFRELHPAERQAIINNLAEFTKSKKDSINFIIRKLLLLVKVDNNIGCTIVGREKKPYSIWKKMQDHKVSFDKIYDLMGFRIIVPDIPSCYVVLGIVNSSYKMIPDTFKDFISNPKKNGYQSLHISVIGPTNTRIEIQIRTDEMHRFAEYGIAAHWVYKQGASENANEISKYKWLQDMVETFEKAEESTDAFEDTKIDLHQNEIFVFTPSGDIVDLPQGGTVLDFAYDIHSDVGNRCVGGKVNGVIAPLKAELKNGDEVEIITSKNSKPKQSWLEFVKTAKAKSAIRQFFRNLKLDENELIGRDIIKSYFNQIGCPINDSIVRAKLDVFGQKSVAAVYGLVAEGIIKKYDFLKTVNPEFARKMATEANDEKIEAKIESLRRTKNINSEGPMKMRGIIPGLAMKLSKCCCPIPGDKIVGIVHTGRGLTIHKVDCPNLKYITNVEQRKIDLDWDSINGNERQKFVGKISAALENTPGTLAKFINLMAEKNINIINIVTTNENHEYQQLEMSVEVEDSEALNNLIASARSMKFVYEVERI